MAGGAAAVAEGAAAVAEGAAAVAEGAAAVTVPTPAGPAGARASVAVGAFSPLAQPAASGIAQAHAIAHRIGLTDGDATPGAGLSRLTRRARTAASARERP